MELILLILIVINMATCKATDTLTCSRSSDTFQLSAPAPETPPPPQRSVPGKRGPTGLQGIKGAKGAKGEKCPSEAEEIAQLQVRIRSLEQQLSHITFVVTPGFLESGWYSPANGYQYKITTNQQNWSTSRRICQEMGGDLAVYGPQDVVMRTRLGTTIVMNSGGNYLWIGLDDQVQEGAWKWIDGTSSTKHNTHWGPREPSGGSRANCGQMFSQIVNYEINDDLCSRQRYAICEKRLTI